MPRTSSLWVFQDSPIAEANILPLPGKQWNNFVSGHLGPNGLGHVRWKLCSWVVHCGFVPVPPFFGAPCLSAYQSWLNLLSYRSLFWRSRRVGSKGIASVQRRRNRSSLHFRTAELRPALHRTLCRNHSKWFVAKELGGAMAIKRLCTCHGIECWNGHAWNSWIFDVFVLLSAIRVPP